MLPNAKSQVQPSLHIVPLLQMLYSCIPLEQLLHLTLHSLILYNTTLSRSKEIVDISLDLYYSCFAVTLPLSNFHDIANEPVSDYTHLFLFFDSDEIISESHFVHCCSSVVELEGVIDPFDWFGLNDELAANGTYYVLSKATPSDLNPTVGNLPTAMAYNNASLTGQVDPALQLSKDNNPSFLIVFDSGTSLVISWNRDDFIGPICGFPEVRHLGGMAGGMLIKGIGDVQWMFCIDQIYGGLY